MDAGERAVVPRAPRRLGARQDRGRGPEQEAELGVGQLEDRSAPYVEASLREAEVLLGRVDQHQGRLDSLLSRLDGDLRLLEALNERQLGRLDPGAGGAEVRLRLLVRRDQV